MTELVLMKTPGGMLAPCTEESIEIIGKWKLGQGVKVKASKARNLHFFRKWWLLAHFAFDIWADTMPTIEHKGERVMPDFERFRKDLTILSGFYHPVFNARGEVRLEAESLSFSSMTEERFDALYSATINAILAKILPKAGYTEESLRSTVDRLMEFA